MGAPDGFLMCNLMPEFIKLKKAGMGNGAEVINYLQSSSLSESARGTVSRVYEMCQDTCGHWGFDPRDMKCTNFSVWYAKDDTVNPPEHGKWLVDEFDKREGVKLHCKNEEGFGHFTYTTAEYRSTAMQMEILLEMSSNE